MLCHFKSVPDVNFPLNKPGANNLNGLQLFIGCVLENSYSMCGKIAFSQTSTLWSFSKENYIMCGGKTYKPSPLGPYDTRMNSIVPLSYSGFPQFIIQEPFRGPEVLPQLTILKQSFSPCSTVCSYSTHEYGGTGDKCMVCMCFISRLSPVLRKKKQALFLKAQGGSRHLLDTQLI